MEAPAEQWELVESKCKELGATKADECFRLLMVSSSATYHSVEPTSRSLPEEESEYGRLQETVE